MIYHQIFAEIQNEEVKNIIVCKDYMIANQLAQKTYGKDAIAVECTFCDCEIGDTYKNNTFFDPEGNERKYWGNEIENINKLKIENTQLKKQTSEDNETILDHEFRLMNLEG